MDNLDAELKRRGWSRNELATRAGLSNSYFSMMQKGTRKIGSEACKKIAHALGLPIETVYEWAGLIPIKTGERSVDRELSSISETLDEDTVFILIDIARSLRVRRKGANARGQVPTNE